MGKCNFQDDVLPVVILAAKRRFAGDADRETKLADSASVAFELMQLASDEATPGSLAAYAVRRVASGRVFSESIRSIDGPPSPDREKPGRFRLDPAAVYRTGDDPARIAAFRLDVRQWIGTLTDLQRQVATSLAMGDRTGEAADRFGVSAGRVSQIRRELAESWHGFQS